jgi:hypothetical protein
MALAFVAHATVAILGIVDLWPWQLEDAARYRAMSSALSGNMASVEALKHAPGYQYWCAMASPTGYAAIVRIAGEAAARMLVALTAVVAVAAVAFAADFFRFRTRAINIAGGVVALWPVSLFFAGSLTPSVVHAHLFVAALCLFAVGAGGWRLLPMIAGALMFGMCAALRPSMPVALCAMLAALFMLPRRIAYGRRMVALVVFALPALAGAALARPLSGDYSALVSINAGIVDVSRLEAVFRAALPMMFVPKIGHVAILGYLLLAAWGTRAHLRANGRYQFAALAWGLWGACVAAAYLDPLSSLRMNLPGHLMLAPFASEAIALWRTP